MVLNCVVTGCSNEHDKNKPKSFHAFPFKRPDILELWITAVGRKNWYPSKTSKICEDHFLPSDYLNMPGYIRKHLKLDAVPSVFNISRHQRKCITHTNNEDIEIEEPMDVKLNTHPDNHSPSISTTPRAFLDSKNLNMNPDVNLPSTIPQIFVDKKDLVRNTCVHLPYTYMTTPKSFVDSEDSNMKPDVNSASTSTTPQIFVGSKDLVMNTYVDLPYIDTTSPKSFIDGEDSNMKPDVNSPSTSTTLQIFVESKDLVMNTYVDLPYTHTTTPKSFIDGEDSNMKPDVNSASTSTKIPKSFVDRAVLTSENHLELQRLKKKLKILQQKVRRRDVTISKMKKIINEVKKSGHNNKKLDEVLKNYFEGVDFVQIEITK